jgi:hypothetical protein
MTRPRLVWSEGAEVAARRQQPHLYWYRLRSLGRRLTFAHDIGSPPFANPGPPRRVPSPTPASPIAYEEKAPPQGGTGAAPRFR